MALDPYMQALLDQFGGAFALDFDTLDVATYRGFADQVMAGEPLALAEVRELHLAGELPARLYRPVSEAGLPLLVFFHGGGFVAGNIDTHDDLCRRLALGSGAVVVSVGYRLAPETRFPGPAEDCYRAVCELAQRADELGVDASRLALAGDSAGGNLSIAAARLLTQRGGPQLRAQCLFYPVTDQTCGSASYREFARGHFLEAAMMHWFWQQYLGQWPAPLNVLASPLHAADLGSLPPTLLMSAAHDPLRDEGEAFAERARAAGADVTLVRAEGMLHGFASFAPFAPRAADYLAQACAWLRGQLA